MAETTIQIYDDFGYEWTACIEYTKHCVRSGSFSSGALDPEEYYGIFEHELDDVKWIESDELNVDGEMDYPQAEDGVYLMLEGDDVPEWAWDACKQHCKEWD